MGKKKANQEPLPGMEARDVPEIEQAAENYRKIRDERCELSKREAEAKSALIQVLKNLGRSFYQYNGLKVQLEVTDNVKVRASEDGDEEPTGTFKQPRRKRQAEEIAEEWIGQAEELIEQQQAEPSEEERERLHREAVANWRRQTPSLAENEPGTRTCECGDFETDHAEGGACMLAACECKEFKEPEPEEEGMGFHPGFPPGFDPERAAKGLPQEDKADDFTAPRCDECGRIDGAHTKECSHSHDLRFSDYLAYAEAHYKKNHQSHARKMELTRLKDEEVRAWKQQQASNGAEAEPETKKGKSKKLSPVEAAIDR